MRLALRPCKAAAATTGGKKGSEGEGTIEQIEKVLADVVLCDVFCDVPWDPHWCPVPLH